MPTYAQKKNWIFLLYRNYAVQRLFIYNGGGTYHLGLVSIFVMGKFSLMILFSDKIWMLVYSQYDKPYYSKTSNVKWRLPYIRTLWIILNFPSTVPF